VNTAPGTDQPLELGVSDELYFEYRESVPALEDLALYGTGSSTTRAEGQVDQLFLTQATPSFFTTLGAQPLLGRLPTDEDGNRVVVISHWLWRNWFGSDPSVIDRSYTFANETRTVIGVMKPEFRFPDERVAFWVPMTIRAAQVTPGGFGPRAVARMKPEMDPAALVAQLEPLARRVQQRLGGPAPYVRIMEHHRPVVKPLREHLVRNISTALWILLGTVGIVFLIACANVASLFTVRAENRRRDLAVRRALGVRTVFNFDDGGRSVLVDRVQIQQVLINLLRNAVEAMRDSDRRELTVSIAEAEDGGLVALEVSDTGPGVSQEVVEQLFKPFVTTKPGGMGVGLSISRRIVEAHGGELTMRRNEAGGACFRMTLPAIASEEAVA
jgi:anti-sigma regulatory factor (Ser/Thr protein kinase)